MEEFKEIAEYALSYAQERPLDYAEVRLEMNNRDTVSFLNGKLHIGSLPIELTADAFSRMFGINIRILVDGGMAMSSTNNISKSSIKVAVDNAYKAAKRNAHQRKKPLKMSREKSYETEWSSNFKVNPMDISLEERINFLKEFIAIFEDPFPIQFFHIFVLITEERNTYFINNEGARISGYVPRVAFIPVIIGIVSGGKNEQMMRTYASSAGWNDLLSWDLVKEVRENVATLSDIVTKAKKPPQEELDIILGPEVSGIVSHENCGHPHEADRILGREGAQAGESYLREHELGFKIGNDCVNVYDDPTIEGSYGFYLFDDEGVKSRKRKLIKDGIFNEMLHNRETAAMLNTNSNGAARATSYQREPIIRMANTYFAPGDFSFEEMIEDIKLGIYMKSFTEWNIDDKRLEAKYVGQEAYLIENGELKGLVSKPTLEISSIGLFKSIDAQGDMNSLEWQGAFCGKSEPGQGIPVWTGGPNIRLRNIKLAGGE